MYDQLSLDFDVCQAQTPDLIEYHRTIIAFSGGKDSLVCVLWAIKAGCPRIELWHHDIDGAAQQGNDQSRLMDWPVTKAYCRAVAEALNLPIYFSWLEGGFEREMLRHQTFKAATWFETPEGLQSAGGGRGKRNTRQKFPQVSGDLSVRWCSAYLKIDVCAIAINNQDRFNHSKTLVLSGERAAESPQRARYKSFEPDRSDNRDGKSGRHVDRYRPIHQWSDEEVWAIVEEFCITPHPAYQLGWGRLSCLSCIFGSANQWATIRQIAPEHFERIARYEEQFGVTIQRQQSVRELAAQGIPYPEASDRERVKLALGETYPHPVLDRNWNLPAGAYGESHGPI
jgi:3'-phosphoadenosine 5'-phosphosulfate sulfotransferase (PAPS reductase)/FAD synthetase